MDKLNINLNEYLRFFLAGGPGICVCIYLNQDSHLPFDSKNSLWEISLPQFLSLILGSVVYSVYRALIYPLLYKLMLIILWMFGKVKGDYLPFIPIIPSKTEKYHEFRRWKERRDRNSGNRDLIEWSSQVHFLYCSGLLIMLMILGTQPMGHSDVLVHRINLTWTIFTVVLISGLVHHLRLVI